MKRRYVTVDVFSERMFGGNPLAVVLDAVGLSSEQMQLIAAEFNYSETTFVLPPEAAAHTARVRIFTPRTEVPFAGHPNVGTAFVLAGEPRFTGSERFVFEEAAGLVPLTLLRERGAVVGAELRAPQPLSRRSVLTREAAAQSLSLAPEEIDTRHHAPQVVSVGLPFVVVSLNSREALARARAEHSVHAALLPLDAADAVFAYWREPDRSPEAVLHARTFSPLDGVAEDPATGSACAATIALLASLEPDVKPMSWRIHQGVDMGRASLLLGRTIPQAAMLDTYIGGRCVAVLEGVLNL